MRSEAGLATKSAYVALSPVAYSGPWPAMGPPLADPEILKAGGRQQISAPTSFIANTHNEL